MDQDRTKRKLTAIFSADVVGYSRLMEADEAWTIQSLEENKRLISKLIEEYEGHVIDSPGDNLLAEFNSVINAVECAVKIQQKLKKKNDHLIESNRMHFRIGINLGDVVEEDGRIYGNGVNIAARLEGLTDPGGICISRRTYDHVKTRLDLGYEYLGEHNVKNISEAVRVYRVLMDSENAGKIIGEKKASKMVSRRLAVTTFIALIIIAAGSLIWNIYSHQPRKIEQAFEPEKAATVVDVEEANKTIAVLPFENLSSDPEQEYFVDGLTEEILNSLTKIQDLRVIARTSSFAFKGTDKKIQEIADELGANHILEGSVRKAGDALRITAQLIRAEDGIHLWSETYDRKLEDIFAIQEDIAKAVADELKATLGIDKSFKMLGGTDNLEAYELYLVAMGMWQKGQTLEGVQHVLKEIDKAIAMDPKFAIAWVVKSNLHSASSSTLPANRVAYAHDRALEAAMKAIELEPNLVEAHYSLSYSRLSKGDFIGAEDAYRRAVELSKEVSPINEIGFAPLLFNSVANFKKSQEIIENLRRNDPLNLGFRSFYLMNLALMGDAKRVEQEYERARPLFGETWLGDFIITIIRLGEKSTVSPNRIICSGDPICSAVKMHLSAPEKALAELHSFYADSDDLSILNLVGISVWSAYFGDVDFAMDAIEKAAIIDATYISNIWYPVMHKVRQLPRFKEFVREIGLFDYWEQFGWPDICHKLGNGDFECD